MSIFGNIMSSIFGGPAQAAPPPASTPSSVGSTSAPAAAQPTPSAPAAAPPTKAQVDVAAVMDKLAEESDEDLDWRHSIVDLMKLLKLDSSLAARKQLAGELHYTGNTKDSAAMNIWLHKQVMIKLAENGGNVPADLKH
jgi:pyruvate/2-oxoglutarate dehydrogenase complex dihydrolipoamide acyltransferase (E2) component